MFGKVLGDVLGCKGDENVTGRRLATSRAAVEAEVRIMMTFEVLRLVYRNFAHEAGQT